MTTPATTLGRPGWYVYRATVPGGAHALGAATACSERRARVLVAAQPTVAASVSAQTVQPGATVFDRVFVAGLAGEQAPVQAALYGPFATREEISCTSQPLWSGSLPAPHDGELATQPFTLAVAGVYVYAVRLVPSPFVHGADTACGEAAQTTIAIARPVLTARTSTAEVSPGERVSAGVAVVGLAGLTVPARAELWGPFERRSEIRCAGTPLWSGSLEVTDGSFTSGAVRLLRPGFYSYTAATPSGPSVEAASTRCGAAAATTFVRPAPVAVATRSTDVVPTGADLSTTVRVENLGSSAAHVSVKVFGPFPSRAAARCAGRSYASQTIIVRRAGPVASPPVRLARSGFYTVRAGVVGPVAGAGQPVAPCSPARTVLAAPRIITGGRRVGAPAVVRSSSVRTPTRVSIPSIGIDAALVPVVIDGSQGTLGVPADIHRGAWWRDGALPGGARGTVLLAGHVDSAKGGEGAFFTLAHARAGATIVLATAGGARFSYRVASVRSYAKSRLPTGIFSQAGPARLVLVTCGGPFDPVRRRYRDNIVVTAAPAGSSAE